MPLNWRGDVVLGLFAMVVVGIGAWWVNPWVDETATAHFVSYSTWDMKQLWTGQVAATKGVDLAIAPYYLVVHQWVRLVGTTMFTLRLPSIIAAGIGTMAMAATGRILVGRRGQIAYAVCFALLPRVTAMAIEARPYEASAMFVALAVLLLVKIWQRAHAWYWVAFGLCAAAGMLMQIYAAIPLAGLVLAAFIVLRGYRRWLVPGVALLAVAAISPFALASSRQIGQTAAWTDNQSSLVDRFLVESWATTRVADTPTQFSTDVLPHYIASGTAVVALLLVLTAVITARGRGLGRLALAGGVFVFTVGAMMLINVLGAASLWARYTSAAAPIVAMILAEAVLTLRGRWTRVLVALLLIGCLTIFVFQRRPYAKDPHGDYLLMGNVMTAQAQPGDGFLVDPSGTWVGPYRAAIDVNPTAFEDLVDIAVPQRGPLQAPWAPDAPVVDLSAQTDLPDTIWLATNNGQESSHVGQLEALGYQAGFSETGAPLGHTITRWQR